MKKSHLINNNQVKYAVSEANIMKTLDHPYILKLVFSFQTPSNLYMAVELCENGDLSEILDQESLLDEDIAKLKHTEIRVSPVIPIIEIRHFVLFGGSASCSRAVVLQCLNAVRLTDKDIR